MDDVACDLCGSCDHTVVGIVGRFGEPVRNVVCKRCGLVYVSPRMPQDESKQYYEGKYLVEYGKNSAASARAFARLAAERLDFLKSVVDCTGKSLLEVGCGSGAFLDAARAEFKCCVGIEPSAEFADYGRRSVGLHIVQGTLEESMPREKCDVIALFHVLEHLHSPIRSLSALRSCLSDDGVVFVEVPNLLRPPYLIRLEEFFRKVHLYSFTPSTVTSCLQAAGFRRVRLDEQALPSNIRLIAWKDTSGDPGTRDDSSNDYERAIDHIERWRRYERWCGGLRRSTRRATARLVRKLRGGS